MPTPERYAVHKLIVATRRTGRTEAAFKAAKDVSQAETLIRSLAEARRSSDLGFARPEAWDRGPSWRRRLAAGALRLGDDARVTLTDAAETAARLDRRDPTRTAPNSTSPAKNP